MLVVNIDLQGHTDNNGTRQLPVGAGQCPWGGYTDRIVCNIHGEEPYKKSSS